MKNKLGNYMELNNVFNFDISKSIKTNFKTTILIIPKSNLKNNQTLNNNYILTITKKIIQDINTKNEFDKNLKNLLFDVCKHLNKKAVKDTQITLQIINKLGKKIYINLFYLVSGTKTTNNQIYLKNDKLRELGSVIYKNLKHNLFRNVNLFCQDTNELLFILEGFLLSMYEFKKYKNTTLPKFSDQIIHNKYLKNQKIDIKNLLYNQKIDNTITKQSKNTNNKNASNENNNNNINNDNGNNNQNGGKNKNAKINKKNTKINKTNTKKNKVNTKKNKVNTKKNTTNTKKNINLTKSINKENTKQNTIIKKKIKDKNFNNYYVNILSQDTKLKKNINKLLIIIKSIYLCRDLVNEPSNVLTPKSFCEFTNTFIKKHKLPIKSKIINSDELVKKKFSLLHSVGQGSTKDKQSRLLILEYNSLPSSTKHNGFVLIGKGVTHDTGGLSIKGSSSMSEMKTDMAGAAIVLCTILAQAQLKNKKKLVCLIPLAENSVGNKATIPGQVIKGYGNISVEIANTDAEGRLLLADCLSYASQKYKNSQIIDIATLTGSQASLSCQHFSSIVQTNSYAMTNELIKEGEKVGERIVPLPYINDFTNEIKSDIADIKNISTKCRGGLYTSSIFLSKFIKKNTKWVHIDIGSNEFKLKSKYPYKNQEASGLGVKLLLSSIN